MLSLSPFHWLDETQCITEDNLLYLKLIDCICYRHLQNVFISAHELVLDWITEHYIIAKLIHKIIPEFLHDYMEVGFLDNLGMHTEMLHK